MPATDNECRIKNEQQINVDRNLVYFFGVRFTGIFSNEK